MPGFPWAQAMAVVYRPTYWHRHTPRWSVYVLCMLCSVRGGCKLY